MQRLVEDNGIAVLGRLHLNGRTVLNTIKRNDTVLVAHDGIFFCRNNIAVRRLGLSQLVGAPFNIGNGDNAAVLRRAVFEDRIAVIGNALELELRTRERGGIGSAVNITLLQKLQIAVNTRRVFDHIGLDFRAVVYC